MLRELLQWLRLVVQILSVLLTARGRGSVALRPRGHRWALNIRYRACRQRWREMDCRPGTFVTDRGNAVLSSQALRLPGNFGVAESLLFFLGFKHFLDTPLLLAVASVPFFLLISTSAVPLALFRLDLSP